MTTETAKAEKAAKSTDNGESAGRAVGRSIGDATRTAKGVADEAARRLPAGIEATGEAARSAARALDQQSSSQLKVGAAFSIGVATGLLVGGGPRILVVLAGLPGVAMLMALADRRREAGTT